MLSNGYTTNYQLAEYATKNKIPVHAIVYMNDLYDKVDLKYGGYILNLDPQSGHWVAVFIPKDSDYSYYFDSYGLVPPEPVKWLSQKMKKKDVVFSNKQVQALNSHFCGQYSLLFLEYMQKKKGSYKKRYEKFLNNFKDYKNTHY